MPDKNDQSLGSTVPKGQETEVRRNFNLALKVAITAAIQVLEEQSGFIINRAAVTVDRLEDGGIEAHAWVVLKKTRYSAAALAPAQNRAARSTSTTPKITKDSQ